MNIQVPELVYGVMVSYPRLACLVAIGSHIVAGWLAVKIIQRGNRKRYGA